jgi:hypothetical protein
METAGLSAGKTHTVAYMRGVAGDAQNKITHK